MRDQLIPYVRQSRTREETISLDAQQQIIEAWAQANAIPLAPVIVEQNVSGSKAWRKRELGRAIEACERKEAAGIIVAYQDRLSRETWLGTAEVWEALDRAGARLVAAADGIDTARDGQALLFQIRAALAHDQWKRHQRNWKEAKHRKAWERGILGHSPPAGYRRGPNGQIEKTEHADQVAAVFRLRASGASWSEVARAMEGVPSWRGSTSWGIGSLKGMICSPIYKGEHHCTCGCGSVAFRPEWVLVPPSVWEAAQMKPGTSRGRKDPGRSLLGGLLHCGCCGGRMTYKDDPRRGFAYYRCLRRGGVCLEGATISATKAEPFVVESVLTQLDQRPGDFVFGKPVDPATQAELERARNEANDELRLYLRTVRASTPGFEDGVTERETALTEAEYALETYLAEAGVDEMTPEQAQAIFANMDKDVQRSLLRTLIETATVERGTGPAADRIEIAWH